MTVRDSSFSRNSAHDGGAICSADDDCGAISDYSNITITNCTFAENSAKNHGKEIRFTIFTKYAELNNSIIRNNQGKYIDVDIVFDVEDEKRHLIIDNCAFKRDAFEDFEANSNFQNNNPVYIENFVSSHQVSNVTVNSVDHTVFMLNPSDTALIHRGTSKNAPEKDQLGKSRNKLNPSIGAVEYSSGSGSNPEVPNNENDNPEAPNNGNNNSETPGSRNDINTDSGNSGGGGGCNSFCVLITLAIVFTLKRR